jgi:hypothetical protein
MVMDEKIIATAPVIGKAKDKNQLPPTAKLM